MTAAMATCVATKTPAKKLKGARTDAYGRRRNLQQQPPEKRKRNRDESSIGSTKQNELVDISKDQASTVIVYNKARCPLCGPYSKKVFAVGRGMAAHLESIHTPWRPTPLAQKIIRRTWEAQRRQQRQKEVPKGHEAPRTAPTNHSLPTSPPILEAYSPTHEQVEEWESKMSSILQTIEAEFENSAQKKQVLGASDKSESTKILSYKASLPHFLQAAANGNLPLLQSLFREYHQEDPAKALEYLDQTDRHGSVAEHWAAGGGHLECLRYLWKERISWSSRLDCENVTLERPSKKAKGDGPMPKTRKVRRRDGKTALHYACRNGQLACVRYLVEEAGFAMDETTGEGTTPLHMACYGGHLPVVQYLMERSQSGNLAQAVNDWGCGASHWVAMTINKDSAQIEALCQYLQTKGQVNFASRQQQGHSALHKAAQKLNKHVLEWMSNSTTCHLSAHELQEAAGPDQGGHRPSDIWRAMGGDEGFASWMQTTMHW